MPFIASVGFVILSTLEAAQQPYSLPVAHAGQTIQAETSGGAQQDQGPAQPPPTWPVTIDDAEKASRAGCGNPEQCRAEQREYSDLHAQWKAAEAAEGQKSLALWQTCIAGIATLIATAGTWFLIGTMRENRRAADAGTAAAQAALEANEINRKAMAAEQRPWVSVTYEIGGPIEWTADGCNLQFVFWLENVGKTPAVRAYLAIEIIAVTGTGLQALQLAMADRVRKGERRGLEITVFPGQKIRHNILYTIPMCDLDSAKNRLNCDWISPVVIGCFDYRSPSNDVSHQTGFIYQVSRVPNEDGFVISPSTGDVKAADIMLIPWIEGARID